MSDRNSSQAGPDDRVYGRAFAQYRGDTYYGRPAIKSSLWDWRVSGYVFVGGMAGSAQIIAAAAERFAPGESRDLVRNARYLGVAGAAVGSALLIADLHTPQRWYNMLRIFRPTSPMSIGTYILSAFGLSTGIAAAGQVLDDRLDGQGRSLPGRIARAAQIPAAIAGAGMSVYTASLLSSTSTPLWAAAPRHLAHRFGTSAMASAAAALSLGERLGGRSRTADRLDGLALAATAAELAASLQSERRLRAEGVAGALEEGSPRLMDKAGSMAVGMAAPVLTHAANLPRRRPSPTASVLASVAILAGSALMRHAILRAGNRSAKRPGDYFRFAQEGPRRGGELGQDSRERPLRQAAGSAAERKPETIAVGARE